MLGDIFCIDEYLYGETLHEISRHLFEVILKRTWFKKTQQYKIGDMPTHIVGNLMYVVYINQHPAKI